MDRALTSPDTRDASTLYTPPVTILLMRHGEADGSGVEAELTFRGRAQVTAVAALAGSSALLPIRILHSGLRRTIDTAALLATAFPQQPPVELGPGLQPDDDVAPWVTRIKATTGDLAIVSHQPFLTRLCGLMLSGHEGLTPVEFRTATAAVLRPKDATTWTLETLIHAPR